MAHSGSGNSKKFAIVLSVFQVVFIVLFGIFAEYHYDARPPSDKTGHATTETPVVAVAEGRAPGEGPAAGHEYPVWKYYPMFQDVHVMMFIGFGYLMTFLRKYGYSSLGINFLLAAFVIQWATLMRGFLHMHDWHFQVDLTTLLTSDFTAAVILITFGAVLGKLSPLQYLMMAFVEVAVFSVNEWIGVKIFKTLDVGGSIFVHVFGAYFGLAVSRMQSRWEYGVTEFSTLKFNTKTTDLFSMIGTIFLWMYWPSFNSAVASTPELQQRAVINTYFCLASCCVVTFICSYLFHSGKFSMELVQNATLAGGVAIGSTADMMLNPYGALIIGAGAAILSCVGFHFISSVLENKLKIHDTCGVNNLHGMPGILAALISAVVCATATEYQYKESLYDVFPELKPVDGVPGRTPLEQAGYQMAALGLTLAMALVTGAITGTRTIFVGPALFSLGLPNQIQGLAQRLLHDCSLSEAGCSVSGADGSETYFASLPVRFCGLIIRMSIWDPLPGPALFDDGAYWALPDEVTYEHEAEIRHRLRTLGRDNYEIAAAVPLSKGFPQRDNNV